MNNYISISVILDDLLDHPLMRDLTRERAVNYALRFILIVNIPKTYEEKTASIAIDNYRGVLPCDFHNIILARTLDGKIFRASTDNFHYSPSKQDYPDLTYKIQGGCIFTSSKDKDIEISYQAITVDLDGYPLIPDNAAFINALELYIKEKHFNILFDLGKITLQALQNALQEYAWAVGLALASMAMPTIDEMQSITNSHNTMLIRTNEHRRGFVSNGTLEFLKVK